MTANFSLGLLWMRAFLKLFPIIGCLALTSAAAADSFSVAIHVDASSTNQVWKPIWRYFGADEPNYAYLPHGQKLLGELGQLTTNGVYFRAHNLLTSGDGTPALKWGSTGVYQEDVEGRAVYDWAIVDRI